MKGATSIDLEIMSLRIALDKYKRARGAAWDEFERDRHEYERAARAEWIAAERTQRRRERALRAEWNASKLEQLKLWGKLDRDTRLDARECMFVVLWHRYLRVERSAWAEYKRARANTSPEARRYVIW